MKTIYTLLGLMALSIYGYGQSIELAFIGQDAVNHNPVFIDSVMVTNLTKGCDTTLYGNDPVLELFPTGIDDLDFGQQSFDLIQNYPNPFQDLTTFGLQVLKKERIIIQVFSLLGQKVTEYEKVFPPGIHLFQFTGTRNNFYLLTASNGKTVKSLKLVSTNPTNVYGPRISYIAYSTEEVVHKNITVTQKFTFSYGDQLEYTGYASGYFQYVMTDSPMSSMDYILDFELPYSFSCGDSLVDERDGRIYETVQIGSQCWISENLNIGSRINGSLDQQNNTTIEKYCYNNTESNCDMYGGLYQWDEMMQYDTNGANQGICPKGWRLPSVIEWYTLIHYLGGAAIAGEALMLGGTSGFEALLGGKRESDGSFSNMGTGGYFSSTMKIDNQTSWYRYLLSGDPGFYKESSVKVNGYSVRCIKGYPNRLKPLVVVIDTNVYQLLSDSLELSQGIYRYQILQQERDTIGKNTIIIGITDHGYLREVTEASQTGDELTLSTEQATLEDIFESAEFSFDIEFPGDTSKLSTTEFHLNYLADGITLEQTRGILRHNIDSIVLYEQGPLKIYLKNSYIELDPRFHVDFEFDWGLEMFEIKTDQAYFGALVNIGFDLSHEWSYGFEKELFSWDLKTTVYVPLGPPPIPPLPVIFVTNIKLVATDTISVSAGFNLETGFSTQNHVTMGFRYDEHGCRKIWNYTGSHDPIPPTIDTQVKLANKLSLVPEISCKVYDVIGPYFNVELFGKYFANISLQTPHFWDMGINAGLNLNMGVDGKSINEDLIYNWDLYGFEKNLWIVPDSLVYKSGNNQTAYVEKELPDTLTVQVVGSLLDKWSLIPVEFTVMTGGGSVSESVVYTDTLGFARTTWTLGQDTGVNKVFANVKKADGSFIRNCPYQFIAQAYKEELPEVITDPVMNITQTMAYCGGDVTNEGGSPVTARGICWSTAQNPTIENNHTLNGEGFGTFMSNITDLTENTTYYVRAYATNYTGTAYGNEQEFTTLSPPIVTTSPIADTTETTATGGGNVLDDGGSPVFTRGVCWSISPNPTSLSSHTNDGEGTGIFTSNITGLSSGTRYYIRAYAINDVGVGYGDEIDFVTLGDDTTSCPGIPIVEYEGQTYNTVLIGTQCWLKENLNVGTRIDGEENMHNNGLIEKYCYWDREEDCDIYGGLYLWDEMMQYVTAEGVQGICPDGWHIPTDDEWKILEGTVDSFYPVGDPEWDGIGYNGLDAGGNLKETGTTHWDDPNEGATNSSGFTGLPAGHRIAGSFGTEHSHGHFWSSTQEDYSMAWKHRLLYLNDDVYRTNTYKAHGFSVRCLQD